MFIYLESEFIHIRWEKERAIYIENITIFKYFMDVLLLLFIKKCSQTVEKLN